MRPQLVPGVELSAVHDGLDVHVLGYFVDAEDPGCSGISPTCARRGCGVPGRWSTALADAGFGVTLDEVLALSDGGAVGRSHIARALVRRAMPRMSPTRSSGFIGRGRPFYVGKDVRSPDEVVGVINEAGGVAGARASGGQRVEDLIGPTRSRSGLRGIEAYHADQPPEQRARSRRWPRSADCSRPGARDYHGPHAPNPRRRRRPTSRAAARSAARCGVPIPRRYARRARTAIGDHGARACSVLHSARHGNLLHPDLRLPDEQARLRARRRHARRGGLSQVEAPSRPTSSCS